MGLQRGQEGVSVKMVTKLTSGDCCQDRLETIDGGYLNIVHLVLSSGHLFTRVIFVTCWGLGARRSPPDTVLNNVITARNEFGFYWTKHKCQEDPNHHLTRQLP